MVASGRYEDGSWEKAVGNTAFCERNSFGKQIAVLWNRATVAGRKHDEQMALFRDLILES